MFHIEAPGSDVFAVNFRAAFLGFFYAFVGFDRFGKCCRGAKHRKKSMPIAYLWAVSCIACCCISLAVVRRDFLAPRNGYFSATMPLGKK